MDAAAEQSDDQNGEPCTSHSALFTSHLRAPGRAHRSRPAYAFTINAVYTAVLATPRYRASISEALAGSRHAREVEVSHYWERSWEVAADVAAVQIRHSCEDPNLFTQHPGTR